jgi:excisionase family DNA binding protein
MTPLLTIPEAAKILHCHPDTVRNAIRRGRLKAHKVEGAVRISEAAVNAYLEAREIETANKAAPPASPPTRPKGFKYL